MHWQTEGQVLWEIYVDNCLPIPKSMVWRLDIHYHAKRDADSENETETADVVFTAIFSVWTQTIYLHNTHNHHFKLCVHKSVNGRVYKCSCPSIVTIWSWPCSYYAFFPVSWISILNWLSSWLFRTLTVRLYMNIFMFLLLHY